MWASFEEVGKSGVGALFCLTNNRLKFMKKNIEKTSENLQTHHLVEYFNISLSVTANQAKKQLIKI